MRSVQGRYLSSGSGNIQTVPRCSWLLHTRSTEIIVILNILLFTEIPGLQMVNTSNRRYVQRGPGVAHHRRRSPCEVPVAQCILKLVRLVRQVNLKKEEVANLASHSEVRESTPHSTPVEGNGFEGRWQFFESHPGDGCFGAPCPCWMIFFGW